MKIGLIGTGYWADDCHAPAIEARDDLEFVGVWGRDAGKAGDFASRHSTRAFATPAELFAAVDIVSFAVPPTVESELAPRAADAGCDLLLEKPIAKTVAAADMIVEAVARNDVRSIVNFTNVIAGASGQWIRETVIGHDWDGGEVSILGTLRNEESPFLTPWRLEDDGSLWDIGPHAVSMLLAGLGPVAEVRAQHGRADAYNLLLQHERGGISTLSVSYSLPAGTGKFSAGFWGADGVVAVPPSSPVASDADYLGPTLDMLVRGIESGEPIPYDAAFGASVTRVLAEAELSAQEKR